MLMLNRFICLLLFLHLIIFQAIPVTAQSALLFPIKPGIPNTLAGTMGELRSSHFHTGIDVRTGGQEGLQVLAADDGYVSRIAVNPGGYGNAIYIKHPNGHTTVYAHLKSFNEEIAAYVRKKQYQKQSFAVNLFPDVSTFKVNRGDEIALSGNSGSSGGPHLHFDVRNRNQDLLNPLHYGFSEITDIRAPLAKSLALVTSTIDSRANGEFGRIEIPFEYEGNNYFIKDTIHALGRIGLELYAYDRMNNTRFRTGINKIEIKVNNKIHLITTIETWPFSKSKQFYTYLNYEALANNKKRYHKLYIDDGNQLDFYSTTTNRGYLNLEANKVYDIDIVLTDSYDNQSNVHFILKGNEAFDKPLKNTARTYRNWRIDKNTLVLESNPEDTLVVFLKGIRKILESTYTNSQKRAIYLWDLKKEIPDSISINGIVQQLPIKALVPAGIEYKFYNSIVDIQFGRKTLFSDLYLTLESKMDTVTGFEIISIGNTNIPLNKIYTVAFKPSTVPTDKQYLAVYGVWGKNSAYVGGKWSGDQISFKTRNFGNYTLLADSIPPNIKPLILNNDEMVFKITDNLSGVKEYSMTINSQWVLMNYDPKKNLIWAEKPNSNFTFKGKLELRVSDNMGNESIHSTELL